MGVHSNTGVGPRVWCFYRHVYTFIYILPTGMLQKNMFWKTCVCKGEVQLNSSREVDWSTGGD